MEDPKTATEFLLDLLMLDIILTPKQQLDFAKHTQVMAY